MAQSGTQIETVQGRVEQTNEKGLKLDGRWFNWSQYTRSNVRPQEGDDVELEIARGKFINGARILNSAGGDQELAGLDDDDSFGGAPPLAPPGAPPRAATAVSRPVAPSYSATPNADRNTEIRRLALIKAAADYASTRELGPEAVITLAALWEEWVTGQR